MTANTHFKTILNWLMMSILILVFGGAGLWILIAPDSYTGVMDIAINGNLGRAEVRALGGLYFLAGAFGLFAFVRQSWLKDSYKVFTYLLGGILIGRLFSFAHGNFEMLIVLYAVSELIFIAYTIYRIREM